MKVGRKSCSRCGESKELEEFYKNKASKDGLTAACKDCIKATQHKYNAKNAEKIRLRSKAWYAENKGRALERERLKRLANLEAFRAKGRKYARLDKGGAKRRIKKWLADPANQERKRQKDREWRERNRERKAANDKRWAKENRDRRNEIVRRYRENNPETMRLRSYVDGARRRGVPTPDYETRDFILILENDPCCYCGAPMEHIDHIEALTKGGGGEWDNLTASCQSCNLSKQAKSLLRFLLTIS